jgi:N-acetylmuramoyl-L-alanine amidase
VSTGVSDADLHLDIGAEGPAVADLQRRLGRLGIPLGIDHEGAYGPGTRAAVEAFQHRRGLRIDGICGPQTWSALVEAGCELGDRFLYRRSPMLRGDDVAELQQRLSALGFDTGRVDGIFGDQTSIALGDFQRNVGLPVDHIAGGATMRELLRFGTRHDDSSELVTAVRDRERLRQAPRTLTGRRVAIGGEGGLSAALAALRRLLIQQGSTVFPLQHPDGSVQAADANAVEAEVFVGLRLEHEGTRCTTAYYAGYRYSSPGGRRLAELIQRRVCESLALIDGGSHGMSLPLLRETRMPAVICEISPPAILVEQAPSVARAVVTALAEWAATAWD